MTGSWKTSVSGAFTAFFMFVLFSPETFHDFPWLLALAKFAVCGGLVAFGVASKDFNVTGKPMQVQPPTTTAEIPVQEPKQ